MNNIVKGGKVMQNDKADMYYFSSANYVVKSWDIFLMR